MRTLTLDDSVGSVLPAWMKTALPDVTSVLESTKRRVKETSESLKYEKIAHKIFSDFGDLDGDGAVDANELYAMSLKLYCATTQYMPQVLTPPSLSHVQALFKAFDLDGSGKLNREEFMLLASIWFENCALRIAAQSSICLLLAPLAARRLVGALADVVLYTHEAEPAVDMSRSPPFWRELFGGGRGGGGGASAAPLATVDETLGATLATYVPESLAPYIAHQAFVITTAAAILVATTVPPTLALLDEYYLLRSARKTSRALSRTPSGRLRVGSRVAPLTT